MLGTRWLGLDHTLSITIPNLPCVDLGSVGADQRLPLLCACSRPKQCVSHILQWGFVQAMEFLKNYEISKRKCHIWKNYGILKRKFHIWKNWNLSKTAVPMEKLWNFVLVEKNACFLNQRGGGGGDTSGLRCGFSVCCFGYHFTSFTNLPGYSASLLLGRVNTC